MKSSIQLLAPLFLFFASAVGAEDFATPEDAVQSYITGVSTGSGAHILEAFSATAMIQYYNQDDAYRLYTREEFAKAVDSGNDWDAEIRITNMLRTGHAANATVEFTWGDEGEHGYVDYLNLMDADGSWRITNKSAQYLARD